MVAAYDGEEPYIFISYSHKDSADVIKAVDALYDNGFRVWYDNGIEAGTEWPEYIAERMMNSQVVIAFMSCNSQESHNCRREIHFAIELKKELLVVYLEDFELSPGMRLQLSALQAMYRSKYKDDAEFLARLCNAAIIQKCKAPADVTKPEVTRESKEKVDYSAISVQTSASEPAFHKTVAKETTAKMSDQELLRKVILACNENREVRKTSCFKFTNEVSQRQIENAVRVIAKEKIKKGNIVALMDTTLFENGKDGYIVTENHFFSGGVGLFAFNFDFTLKGLTQVKISEGDHLILIYKNGKIEDCFFGIFTRYFEVFFKTYITEKNGIES